jgi:hypothetical protein
MLPQFSTTLPATTIAYAAGLFDGEGHVTIGVSVDKRRGRNRPVYRLYLAISNTDRQVLEWLRDSFGCGVVARREANPTTGKVCCRWQLANRNATRLLVAMLPYLRIKRPQAELMIEFRGHFLPHGSHGVPLSYEAVALREDYRRRLRELNGWNWQKAKAG